MTRNWKEPAGAIVQVTHHLSGSDNTYYVPKHKLSTLLTTLSTPSQEHSTYVSARHRSHPEQPQDLSLGCSQGSVLHCCSLCRDGCFPTCQESRDPLSHPFSP